MMPTDIEDLQGYDPLINGKSAEQNWTGLFTPGERVRLRFINSSAMTYFDVRIPGLEMTVVQADGNNVQPVPVDEFRIAVAETYDVIVKPTEDRAYTIFAESMGRTAYGRGTLAPREGMAGRIPDLRQPPLLTMADMGMAHEGMDHAAMGHGALRAAPIPWRTGPSCRAWHTARWRVWTTAPMPACRALPPIRSMPRAAVWRHGRPMTENSCPMPT